jgi:RNA polymerase sigma factor for flagellar operon FliA
MATPVRTAYEKAEGAEGAVKQLVMDHLHLVRSIVNRVCGSLQPNVSEEDLIGAGTLGLVEAAHRYDPSAGVKFITFAYTRVKGAVVDFLRQNDHLGKAARAQVTALRKAIRSFCQANGRKPTIEELAVEAGLSEQEVLRYLAYEKWDYVGSLDATLGDGQEDEGALDGLVPVDPMKTPPETAEWRERLERLGRAIEHLPEREKQIIIMYYYEELYMAEMAQLLGISESRVSQLHTRALYNLTRMLEGG